VVVEVKIKLVLVLVKSFKNIFGSLLSHAAMRKRGLCHYAVSVCVYVHLSVTFVSCVKTNKHIIKIFSSSGSHTILVFSCQTAWQYSDRYPPNMGVKCRWGRQKLGF